MDENQEGGSLGFKEEARKWGHELWEIGKILAISIAIVLPIRYYVVQPFIVRGASMEPNFEDREYLVIDELSYQFRAPERGEAIVFRYPRSPRQFFIKRIIGLPGEEVEIKSGRVAIIGKKNPDGVVLDEPYLDPPNRSTHPDVTITLKENEYFVLGDNRDASSDSRIWGALERRFVMGRVLFRVWPPSRFGILSDPAFVY